MDPDAHSMRVSSGADPDQAGYRQHLDWGQRLRLRRHRARWPLQRPHAARRVLPFAGPRSHVVQRAGPVDSHRRNRRRGAVRLCLHVFGHMGVARRRFDVAGQPALVRRWESCDGGARARVPRGIPSRECCILCQDHRWRDHVVGPSHDRGHPRRSKDGDLGLRDSPALFVRRSNLSWDLLPAFAGRGSDLASESSAVG